MPDRSPPTAPLPRQWPQVLADLPLEAPAADGWQRLSARLDAASSPPSTAPARPRWPWWMATAAALALAVALPWQLRGPTDASDRPGLSSPTVAAQPQEQALERLYAQSAQLEAVLRVASDDRVASATAAALAGELETRLAMIDAALMQPELSTEQQLSLWRQRVEDLQRLTGFESQQRWLSAQGTSFDAALVYVD